MAFFDPTRPSYLENPYPALARLRAEEPVHRWQAFEAWVVTGYEACSAVLQDEQRFLADPVHAQGPEPVRAEERRRRELLFGGVTRLVSTDPPEHTRRRAIVSRAFAARPIEERRAYVQQAVDRLLEPVVLGEPFDLMATLAQPLPLDVIGEQMGAAPEDRETVVEGAKAMLSGTNPLASQADLARGVEAKERLAAYLERAVAGEVGTSGGGVIGALAGAVRAGTLTHDELLALTVDITTAGNRAVEMGIGCSVLALLRHPDQLEVLRADPDLVPSAVEELLRYDTPAQALPSIAAADVELGRRRIRAGDKVFVMPGAANRDPTAFGDPEKLDLHRNPRRHLSFAAGIHACLGASLARLELEVVLRTLVTRYHSIALAPGAAVEQDSDFMNRGPHRLMVVVR